MGVQVAVKHQQDKKFSHSFPFSFHGVLKNETSHRQESMIFPGYHLTGYIGSRLHDRLRKDIANTRETVFHGIFLAFPKRGVGF